MAKPRGVDGRHKAGHDRAGQFINRYHYKSRELS